MMNPIAFLIYEILDVYEWVVIVAVIVSWLTAFNVINQYNHFVRTVLRILLALTEPVFRPIRKIVPAIIVVILIEFLKYTIRWMSVRYGY